MPCTAQGKALTSWDGIPAPRGMCAAAAPHELKQVPKKVLEEVAATGRAEHMPEVSAAAALAAKMLAEIDLAAQAGETSRVIAATEDI